MTLLLQERVITAQPSLVKALGLAGAVVLQQMHWHMDTADHGVEHDGHTWYPVTQEALAKELGLSREQVQRAVASLEADGLVESCQPEGRASRRKWHRIVYSHPRLNPDCAESHNGVCGSAQSQRAESHTPPLLDVEATRDERAKEEAQLEQDFDAAWAEYPRKTARKRALRAYIAARRKGVTAQGLLIAVQNYARERRGQDQAYTMHGATFFGPDERWRDYGYPVVDRATMDIIGPPALIDNADLA